MGFLSGLGKSLGLRSDKVSFPEFPSFPETQFAKANVAQGKAAELAANIDTRRREERLNAQMRGQNRQIQRALSSRGMQRSGYKARTLRELQESQRVGMRDIEEQRSLALANIRSRQEGRELGGRERYDFANTANQRLIAQARQRSADQTRAGRMAATMGMLSFGSDFLYPQIFGGAGQEGVADMAGYGIPDNVMIGQGRGGVSSQAFGNTASRFGFSR